MDTADPSSTQAPVVMVYSAFGKRPATREEIRRAAERMWQQRRLQEQIKHILSRNKPQSQFQASDQLQLFS